MRKSTRFFALCLSLVMCTTLMMTGALGEATAQPTEVPATDAPVATAAPAATSPDDILANVNGQTVLRSDMDMIFQSLIGEYANYGYDTNDATLIAQVQSQALGYAVQYKIMDQKAKELGLDVFTDTEKADITAKAQSEWDYYIDMYTQQNLSGKENPTDEEKATAKTAAETAISEYGVSVQTLTDSYTRNTVYERLIDYLMTQDGVTISDADVQAEYESRVAADKESYANDVGNYEYTTQYSGKEAWYIPEGMRGITHILLSVDSALLDTYTSLQAQLEEQQDAAQATAEPTQDPSVTPDPAATATAEPTASPEPTATPVPVTQADIDAAKAAILASVQTTIDEINGKLAAGESFASLVETYGTDPGMQSEPYKTEGYSVHKDSIAYDPAFVAGAFSEKMQKIGDISDPVVGSYGVHILCYTRDVPSGAVALDDARKATLQDELKSTKESEVFSKYMNDWMTTATVEYTTDLKPAQ